MGQMKTLITAGQFAALAFPDERVELCEGELIRMSPTGAEHGIVAGNVARILGHHIYQQGLGTVLTAEAGFRLSESTVRAPDVSFISAARLAAVGRTKGFFPGAPDLAVEIVSPDDSAGDLAKKIQEYFAAGARLVWVLYPNIRQLHSYTASSAVRVLGASETLTGEEMLPGFSVRVADYFE